MTSIVALAPAPTARDAHRAEFETNKLRKRLRRQVGQAIADFAMIEAGDRVMVCVSGGKDSYGLLDILLSLQARAPVPFEIVAVNLDQKQPDFPADILPAYLAGRGVSYRIEEQDTYSVVKRVIPEGGTMCSLCSRLRRGVLYRVAGELGATKIALGHHRDDILATFFLNLFFGGKLKTMPPKLVSDDGKHIVIRPLAYVRERDLARYAAAQAFPIIPCNLCGSQENLQRRQVGEMLREWEKKYPGRIESIFNAMGNVVGTHLLDRALQDFARDSRDRRAASRRRHRFRRRSVRDAAGERHSHRDRVVANPFAAHVAMAHRGPIEFMRARSLINLARCLLLVWAIGLVATSARAAEPTSGTLSGPALLAALREGGLILYFRHASTDFGQNDEQMTGYENCASQRNLTDRGRSRGTSIGDAIKRLAHPRRRGPGQSRSAARWRLRD